MRPKLVVGNWKCNGNLRFSAALIESLLTQLNEQDAAVEVAVCPPHVYIAAIAAKLADSQVALGAQNVSHFGDGAYTGEVSVTMLQDIGCRFVIVGHSERRSLLGESDETVALKAAAAIQAKLVPILCFGESLEQRRAGETLDVCRSQLLPVLDKLSALRGDELVLAYEPVWAIGTGETASAQQVQEVHGFVRGLLAERFGSAAGSVRILYGGSVKPNNAAELFALEDVDGGLIGGASLVADEFLQICRS